MPSARVAEWVLAQVLPPDRAASTVGDWLEDAPERGPVWFWSCVLRTVLSRISSDFTESPGFMVGLALRGWLYSFWLVLGTCFGLALGIFILAAAAIQLDWHPSWPAHPSAQILGALIAQVWIGWLEFKTGRWIAHRAPGREFAAGIAACLFPMAFPVASSFMLAEINQFAANRPVPILLPSEIFLLAGIFWVGTNPPGASPHEEITRSRMASIASPSARSRDLRHRRLDGRHRPTRQHLVLVLCAPHSFLANRERLRRKSWLYAQSGAAQLLILMAPVRDRDYRTPSGCLLVRGSVSNLPLVPRPRSRLAPRRASGLGVCNCVRSFNRPMDGASRHGQKNGCLHRVRHSDSNIECDVPARFESIPD
jgi:hypothetical protein